MSIFAKDSGMKNPIMLSCKEDKHLLKGMSDGKTFDKGPPFPATKWFEAMGLGLAIAEVALPKLDLATQPAYASRSYARPGYVMSCDTHTHTHAHPQLLRPAGVAKRCERT